MKKLPLILFLTPLMTLVLIFKPSFTYGQEEENNSEDFEEIEITAENSSLFCTDFNLDYSKEAEENVSLSSTPSGESRLSINDTVSGTIEIEKDSLGQPDFSLMENRLKSSLPNLLPQKLNEEVEIDAQNLQTQARHYISGNGDACLIGEAETSIPQTDIELPSWWGSLLGQTKIFGGLFKAVEAPEKLKIRVSLPEEKKEELFNQLDNEKDKPCDIRDNFTASEKPRTETKSSDFKSCSLLDRAITYIGNFFENVFTGKKTTKDEAKLVNNTRGYLLGGEDFVKQSSFFKDFIPHEINVLTQSSPLETDVSYKTSGADLSLDDENAQKMNFQKQNEVRTQYCLQLCSLYPTDSKFDISTIDPICISCDPKNYQAE